MFRNNDCKQAKQIGQNFSFRKKNVYKYLLRFQSRPIFCFQESFSSFYNLFFSVSNTLNEFAFLSPEAKTSWLERFVKP